jgi:uncharacterized protein YggE
LLISSFVVESSMDLIGRFEPRARLRSHVAVGVAVALLAPIGCAGRQTTTGSGVATPTPATAGPSVREVWEDAYLSFAQAQEDVSAVTVTGVGEVHAPPDRSRISFAVETEDETARGAGEANATLMTTVSTALRAAGDAFPGFRLETSGYSLNPRYGSLTNDGPRLIVGYTARNTVQITVDQVAGIGPLIDAAIGAGANRVAGIGFDVRDQEPYRHEAVRLAVEKARAEAEVIAAALGMRLGPALDVQGGADYLPYAVPYAMDRGMEFAQAVPTPVEAGPQPVTARITVRYRLDVTP